MTSSAVREPAWWSSIPRARRRIGSPGAGWPSRTTMTRRPSGRQRAQARQEPGGAALVATATHGMQQVVAVDEQHVEVSGLGVARHRALSPAATIAACSSSWTSTASSIAAPSPCRACRRCCRAVPPQATSSSTSRTTRAGIAASTWSGCGAMGAPVRPRAGPVVCARHGPGAGPPGTSAAPHHGVRRPRPGPRARATLASRPCPARSRVSPQALTPSSSASTSSSRTSASPSPRTRYALAPSSWPPIATPCSPCQVVSWPVPARSWRHSSRPPAASPTSSSASPSRACSREAAALAGVPVEEAVVIGDGLRTDILAARRVGARSVLVLTGVSTADMARCRVAGRATHLSSPLTPPSWRLRSSSACRRAAARQAQRRCPAPLRRATDVSRPRLERPARRRRRASSWWRKATAVGLAHAGQELALASGRGGAPLARARARGSGR